MRKLMLGAALALAAIAPAAGVADDVDNPNECAARGNNGVFIQTSLDQPVDQNTDRGSGCVMLGGTQMLYIGGELQSERWNGEPCGAVVVAGEQVAPDGQKDFSHEDCD